MRLGQLIGRRYEETPAEASLVSHAFLLRGGCVSGLVDDLNPLQDVVVTVRLRLSGGLDLSQRHRVLIGLAERRR